MISRPKRTKARDGRPVDCVSGDPVTPCRARLGHDEQRIALVFLGLVALPSFAQHYPNRPLRMIVPFTAGSGSDTVARVLAPSLLEALGQRVIVDNRPGAGSTIGTALVAAAPPDGHTLLLTSSGFAGSASLFSKLPYDPVHDFAPITPVMSTALLLVVAPSLGVKTMQELISAAKKKQGRMTFASTGVGSGTHYGAELFRRAAAFDAVHVPFKGVPEALNDTMAGRVDFYFPPTLAALPLVRDGRLHALATTGTQRLRSLPSVPTTVEAGLPQFSYVGWWGMLAPGRTSPAIISRLSVALREILAQNDIRNRFESMGGEPFWMAPGQFALLVQTEISTRAAIFGETKATP